MDRVLCTTISGNHQAAPPSPFRPLPFLSPSAHVGPKLFQHTAQTVQGDITWRGFKYAFPLEFDTPSTSICNGGAVIDCVNAGVPTLRFSNLCYHPAAMGFTVQPGHSVSPAKAGQRGQAAKHGTQWHMLCGFLGTARRTVALLCQASLYCLEPPPPPPLGCSSPCH